MYGCPAGSKMKCDGEEKGKECNVGDKNLFDHRVVVNVPVLFVKRLLTVGAIPVRNGDGFYCVIPELALFPPSELISSELAGFEGRGRVLGGPGTFRRMSIRVRTDAAFIGLSPLRFWSHGDILCCIWGAKSSGTAFTSPLGPVVWSSTFAVSLCCRSGASRPACSSGGRATTRPPRPSVSAVKVVVVVFLLFILIPLLLGYEGLITVAAAPAEVHTSPLPGSLMYA